MKPMDQTKDLLIQRFLQATENLFNLIAPDISLEELESDVTVAQIRVMLVLRAENECSMSEISAAVGFAPSTATGIGDGLVAEDGLSDFVQVGLFGHCFL